MIALFEFYNPVNTVKVMLSRSVNLLTFSWAGLILVSGKQVLCVHTFTSNWQLPFLNWQRGENDHRNISWLISMEFVDELGFEIVTSGYVVRYLEAYLVYIDPKFDFTIKCRLQWAVFHKPVILPYILKSISCINIILSD